MALPKYTAARRREIAAALKIDEQYIYQVFAGIKTASPALARKFHAIDPEARLQDLRPDDWYVIWPELCCLEGAPPFTSPAVAEPADAHPAS